MAVRLSALRAGRFLPPRKISVRGWVDPRAIVRLEGLKKSTLSGTWTGDLPVCSIVPQPTMLPRAPFILCMYNIYVFHSEQWTEIECSLSFVGVYSELPYASYSERRSKIKSFCSSYAELCFLFWVTNSNVVLYTRIFFCSNCYWANQSCTYNILACHNLWVLLPCKMSGILVRCIWQEGL
jgi:hypothetical protein